MKIKTNNLTRIFLFLLTVFLFSGNILRAEENSKATIYQFYSLTCPHCKTQAVFLDKLTEKYENLEVTKYEISQNRENIRLFVDVGKELDIKVGSVPFLLIGDQSVLGHSDDPYFEGSLEKQIVEYIENPEIDIIRDKLSKQEKPKKQDVNDNKNIVSRVIEVPFVGSVDTKNLSLPIITFVIALMDGFNPCAMWVLVFLISMLLGMKDRKKMWILGITFIVSSGFVYFLFLSAWLNFFLFIGYVQAVRMIVGLLALSIGVYYIRDFIVNKDGGCKVTGNEKRRAVLEKIKNIALNPKMSVAMIGIITLAFAVNLVELLCSAGLPAIYTQILTSYELPTLTYYLYLAFYILIFMLDDLIVFFIAMISLKAVGISSKYARFSHIIGGAIMLIIGLSMVFNFRIF